MSWTNSADEGKLLLSAVPRITIRMSGPDGERTDSTTR